MLEITERALDQLEQMRDDSGLGIDRCVGLAAADDGNLRFVAVEPGPTDEVIERQGTPIVAVPTALASALDGMMLDFDDTPDAQQFILTHPPTSDLELMADGR
jgi:Fe-S cluster assembly iron-binding protein IscA